MKMPTVAAVFASVVGAVFAAAPAWGQYAPPPQYAPVPVRVAFSQEDLYRMLAPIALYPDALLSQILMAATYPPEVREAAQWLRSNPGLAGEQAVQLAAQSRWDPSVQSITAFPQIVFMMDENIQWTESLGEAFLAQQPYVMDTVQSLRQRALAAGTLRSDAYVSVLQQGPYIVIAPAQPQLVYLPYYDPLIVYGTWWYPAPPMRWRPWPGYAVHHGFGWGPAIAVRPGIFFGHFDWDRRHVAIDRDYRPRGGVPQRLADRPEWRHEPEHRRGEPYRQEELRRRFATAPLQQGPHDRAQQQQGPHDRAQVQPGPHDQAQGQPGPWDRAQQLQRVPRGGGHSEMRREPSASVGSSRPAPQPQAVQPRPAPAPQPHVIQARPAPAPQPQVIRPAPAPQAQVAQPRPAPAPVPPRAMPQPQARAMPQPSAHMPPQAAAQANAAHHAEGHADHGEHRGNR